METTRELVEFMYMPQYAGNTNIFLPSKTLQYETNHETNRGKPDTKMQANAGLSPVGYGKTEA